MRDSKLAAAVLLMEQNLEEPISIDVIALRSHTTVRNLQRLFKKSLECSPRDYYQSLRLGLGKRLLQRDYLSIQEIAYMCGFNSGSAFTRAYRIRYGNAPSKTKKIERRHTIT